MVKAEQHPEVLRAAKELRPLIRATRKAVGGVALLGVRTLKHISPDPNYPMTHNVRSLFNPRGRPEFFPRQEVVRKVSPRINAQRVLPGYDASVVAARASYTQRGRTTRPFTSFDDPSRYGNISVPLSRSKWRFTMQFTDVPTFGPEGFNAPTDDVVLTEEGEADYSPAFDSRYFTTPSLRERRAHAESRHEPGDAFRLANMQFYTEQLAMAGLVAQGLHAYDEHVRVPMLAMDGLYNQWRGVVGQRPLGHDEAFWQEAPSYTMFAVQRQAEA